MPEPVVWTIQTSLKTALNNIDGTGTYFYTAANVFDRSNKDQTFDHGDIILGLNDISRATEETQGKYYWRANFSVTAVIAYNASIADDQVRARVWSDIHTAVMADPHRTVSATEYAIDTQVLSPDIQDIYDERSGVTCTIEVYFRTSLTDPTSL